MERSVGLDVRNPNAWVAAFVGAEEADGHERLVQLIALTGGKIDNIVGTPTREVSTNDSFNVATLSGNLTVGDNSALSCYVQHSQLNGSCIVTPLLCDNSGTVIGCLNPQQSRECMTLQSGTGYYISPNLNWDTKGTGAFKIFPHVSNLSVGNDVKLWVFNI
jgi:hypothetical protein